MKVLQLTSHYHPNIGGVETHLNDLVSALTKRRHEVCVLTYRPLVTNTAWKMYEKRRNLEVLRLPWFPGFFYKLVNNPILEFLYLVPCLFLALPVVLLIKSPDVVQSHGLVAGFVAVFWGKLLGKRVISTTHSIYHFPDKRLYKSFVKWIFSSSDVVLTLSKQSKKEVESLGIDTKKVRVFTYWIDLKKFKKIPGVNLIHLPGVLALHLTVRSKKFIVLFVGRLVKEKGVLVLLEAAKRWDKNITLVIAGTGPLEEQIKNLKFKIKNLIYLGKVDNENLPQYYSAADLVIVPSIHEEGFGRVILESLACGTPVVAANRGAIPEAMDESVGKLINVTVQSIKNTVEYFYKNPDKLKKLSKNARKFAQKKYSERNVEAVLNSYH